MPFTSINCDGGRYGMVYDVYIPMCTHTHIDRQGHRQRQTGGTDAWIDGGAMLRQYFLDFTLM